MEEDSDWTMPGCIEMCTIKRRESQLHMAFSRLTCCSSLNRTEVTSVTVTLENNNSLHILSKQYERKNYISNAGF